MNLCKTFIAACMASFFCASIVHAVEGDANNGANVFTGQCSVCHSVKEGKNKIGPSLAGVVGRSAGSITNFIYSDAMKNSGVTWNKETLNTYLTNPSAMIPGIKMPYQGLPDDKARWDLIAYLSEHSKKQ